MVIIVTIFKVVHAILSLLLKPFKNKMIRLVLSLLLPLAVCFSPRNGIATQFITPGNIKSEEIIQKIAPVVKEQFNKKSLIYGAPVFIRIFKKSHELELWVKKGNKFNLFKTYFICDLSGTLGPKVKEGDRQAPEGFTMSRLINSIHGPSITSLLTWDSQMTTTSPISVRAVDSWYTVNATPSVALR